MIAGINTVVHTGSEKGAEEIGNVTAFINDPTVKVLIASTSTLATGFDGLQKVCSRIAFLTMPWTAAEHEQAVARIVRRHVVASKVELTTVCATLTDPATGDDWSLDYQKLDLLHSKRSLSSAVCDGVIPDKKALEGGLNTVRKGLNIWLKDARTRLEQKEKM